MTEKMSEGEFKKRSLTQYDMNVRASEIARETGYIDKEGKIHPTDANIKAQIDYEYHAQFVPIEVLEDAKKELLSTVHENCWWSTEAGCHAPNWFIYHKQPEDCPKRRLEKWFGI